MLLRVAGAVGLGAAIGGRQGRPGDAAGRRDGRSDNSFSRGRQRRCVQSPWSRPLLLLLLLLLRILADAVHRHVLLRNGRVRKRTIHGSLVLLLLMLVLTKKWRRAGTRSVVRRERKRGLGAV